jgi:hypothetical protein
MKRMLVLGMLISVAGLYAQPPGPPPGLRGRGPGGPGEIFLGGEVFRPGHVVTGAPFSADVVTTSTQTLADGSHINQSNTMHVYRDSEGRTRREETLGNLNGLLQQASPRQIVFIDDPAGGVNYALDATNKVATRSVFRNGAAPAGRPGGPGRGRGLRGETFPRNSANVKTENLGTQTIAGVQAQGTRVTRTIPAGQIGNDQPLQIVNETWYSPDLHMVVMRKSSDPRRGDVVTQVQNLNRSEPPSTLFQVPAEYKVNDFQRRGPALQPAQ